MIYLDEFDEFDRQAISDFVAPYLIHPSVVVVLPKTGTPYFTDRENLVNDYGVALYAGQLLGNYSPGTTYNYAPIYEEGDFEFTVPLNDFEKFIDVLLILSYGFGSGSDEDKFSFLGDVEQFIDDVKSNKLKAFCPGLVEAYMDLIDSLEESEEDSKET